MEAIAKAAESGEVVEGDVTEFNKGGVVVNVKGVKVFVPRSQATMRRDEDYTALVASMFSWSSPVLRPQDRRQHQQGDR